MEISFFFLAEEIDFISDCLEQTFSCRSYKRCWEVIYSVYYIIFDQSVYYII